MKQIIRRNITKDQSRDTGMAMVLLCFVLSALLKRKELMSTGIVLHVVNMVVPGIYRPVAIVWLGLSDLLSAVVSRVLMSIVFFVVVTPIGILGKIFGKDSLKLRTFKSGDGSVMVERNHLFAAADLEKPY